jgi:release factor glutamine methyltransferase
VENSKLEAEVLCCFILGVDRARLYLSLDQRLPLKSAQHHWRLVERRVKGEPLQYVLGHTEFMGHRFVVGPGVLIPRPETEVLVQYVLDRYAAAGQSWRRLWDIGTGCGTIAISIARSAALLEVFASDDSARALDFARRNARDLGAGVSFFKGGLFEPLERRTMQHSLDIITCNPPYVSIEEFSTLPREIRDHEPPEALVAGADGLDFIRAFVEDAPRFLAPGGLVVFEIGAGQADRVRALLANTQSFDLPEILNDLAGIPRVVAASRIQ